MKTARVVIIDDDLKEACTLLQTLGHFGIGAVYIAGDDDKLFPLSPLGGVRTVFLDLNLINQREAKQYIPYAVNVLKQTVEMIPHVTGIICWTKHVGEEIDLLHAELKVAGIEPAFVLAVEDKLNITNSGANGIEDLIKQLRQFDTQMPARKFLIEWEQLLHDAGSATTNDLFRLVPNDTDLLKVLSSIAVASAEEKLTTPELAGAALFIGLSSVHADALESSCETAKLDDEHTRLLGAAVKQVRLNPLSFRLRAVLNGILLTSDRITSATPTPGNLYIDSNWNPAGGFPAALDEKKKRGFIREVFAKRSDDSTADAFVKAVANVSTPCMVEITPPCDHVAGKCKGARLLAGLLINGENSELTEAETTIPAESRLFSKGIEYVWLNVPAQALKGAYAIVINARHLITVPSEDLAKNPPIVRLRHPVLSDIQAWFAAHAARPGYTSVSRPCSEPTPKVIGK